MTKTNVVKCTFRRGDPALCLVVVNHVLRSTIMETIMCNIFEVISRAMRKAGRNAFHVDEYAETLQFVQLDEKEKKVLCQEGEEQQHQRKREKSVYFEVHEQRGRNHL